MVVIGELCMGDLVGPGGRVRPAEDPKVYLNPLVNMFCFTVRLGVISGGKGEVIVEKLSKLLDKGEGKLWAMIKDDLVVEPKA